MKPAITSTLILVGLISTTPCMADGTAGRFVAGAGIGLGYGQYDSVSGDGENFIIPSPSIKAGMTLPGRFELNAGLTYTMVNIRGVSMCMDCDTNELESLFSFALMGRYNFLKKSVVDPFVSVGPMCGVMLYKQRLGVQRGAVTPGFKTALGLGIWVAEKWRLDVGGEYSMGWTHLTSANENYDEWKGNWQANLSVGFSYFF